MAGPNNGQAFLSLHTVKPLFTKGLPFCKKKLHNVYGTYLFQLQLFDLTGHRSLIQQIIVHFKTEKG